MTIVKSVRIEPALWVWLEGRAKKKGVSPNAWLVRCIEDARKRLEGDAAA